MTYLQKKKISFMTIVNRIKGFVRSISGVPPITLPDCVDNNSLINYTISGNSVQGGIPTPDTPVEVESVGDYDEATGKYKIPVVCSGKNILNPEWLKQGTIQDSTGVPLSSTTRVLTDLISLEPGEYYMRVHTYNNLSLRLRGIHIYNYDTEEWEGYTAWNSVQAKSFTISALCKARFIFQTTANDVVTVEDVINGNPMLVLKGAGTDYEPYAEPVTTNIYLDEPLRKIGNYADYIDFENQKVVRNTKVLNSFNSMAKYIHNSSWCSWYFGGFQKAQMTNSLSNICKYIVYDVDFTSSSVAAAMGQATNTTNKTYGLLVRIKNDALGVESSDTDAVKLAAGQQYLNDNRAYFVIRITTPNETQVDLSKLPTVKGTTIYTVGTTTQPSYMSATYYSTVKE